MTADIINNRDTRAWTCSQPSLVYPSMDAERKPSCPSACMNRPEKASRIIDKNSIVDAIARIVDFAVFTVAPLY